MATFELIILSLVIPLLYVIVYMSGRFDVIGKFLKASIKAMEEFKEAEEAGDGYFKVVKSDEVKNERRGEDEVDIYERIEYIITQFGEARDLLDYKYDPISITKRNILNDVIYILREELLGDDVSDEIGGEE